MGVGLREKQKGYLCYEPRSGSSKWSPVGDVLQGSSLVEEDRFRLLPSFRDLSHLNAPGVDNGEFKAAWVDPLEIVVADLIRSQCRVGHPEYAFGKLSWSHCTHQPLRTFPIHWVHLYQR